MKDPERQGHESFLTGELFDLSNLEASMFRPLLLLPFVAMSGCDLLDTRPDCVHQLIVTDPVSGAIDLDPDPRDCREPRDTPNTAEWSLLLTDDLEAPIFDPDPQRICNAAARQALTVVELEGHFAIDPTAEEPLSGPGIVEAEFPENFVQGAWMYVSFSDRSAGLGQERTTSHGNWSAYFQLGEPDSAIYDQDLFGSGVCD